ncbi:MAG: ABC transporter ATP-binding protein [Acidovorax sp.]|uniref:ABC transporter ATP-binding protein n=1 Tax=Acidovorax sp. TaxID=1872122 RepID=UPI00391CC9E5
MLKIENLEVRYGQIKGTDRLSFSVNEGRTLALVGSNGAGKSSTLKAIVGLIRDWSGGITWCGVDLRKVKPEDIVRQGIGYSPEGRRVFSALTVRENLEMGALSQPRGDLSKRLEQVYSYFPRLKERSSQAAGSLSGGEQQMLAIGRALMSRPRVILLDEPSLGVAPVIVERIGEVLRTVQQAEGLTVVLAEQNANWAMRLAHDAVILELGQKIMEGSARELMKDERVRRAYLGI